MNVFAETERLILREILPEDEIPFFEMDSDAEVHRYLGNKPVRSIEEIRKNIALIRRQYQDYGIGRWAVIEKSSGNFIGWSGLKFITEPENNRSHFHDVGYRFAPPYWGKGYATESAKAAIEYGFLNMNLEEIIGTAHVENKASRHALEKCGLTYIETFAWKDFACDWLRITKEEWSSRR